MVIINHLKSTATTSGTDQFDFGNPFWRRYRSEEISPHAVDANFAATHLAPVILINHNKPLTIISIYLYIPIHPSSKRVYWSPKKFPLFGEYKPLMQKVR